MLVSTLHLYVKELKMFMLLYSRVSTTAVCCYKWHSALQLARFKQNLRLQYYLYVISQVWISMENEKRAWRNICIS